MNYLPEDYYSVINIKTGKKICDCSLEYDALMMVSFDPSNRTISKNKFLMSEVIDVKITKELPTSNITVSTVKENGCFPRKNQLKDASKIKKLNQSKLQEVKL